MKRNWTRIAVALGPMIVIATIVWEVARTNPAYNFLVEPWAIDGYETIHGWVFLTVGIALLIAGLVVMMEATTRPGIAAAVVGLIVIEATIIAVVFGEESVTFTINATMGLVLSLILGVVVSRTLKGLVGERLPALQRAWVGLVVTIAIVAVIWFVLNATIFGNEVTLNTAVATLIGFALLGAMSLTTTPRGLAGNRMLLAATVVGGAVITFSAGALRQTLIRMQNETSGAAAQYKDVQVGAGWFLALFGILILFVGAVGLWATRRDTMMARMRARKQRAAAEKSAEEIREAHEQYERERAAAAP